MGLGAGGQAYPDYQRVVNWDGPLLLNQQGVKGSESVEYGPFAVSRYASVAIRASCATRPVKLNLLWSADKAGTVGLGERQVWLSPNISLPLQLRLLNVGPWLRIVASPKEAKKAYELSLAVIATNRIFATETVPPLQLLVALNAQKIAAGATVELWPETYFGGPVLLHAVALGEAMTILVAARQSNLITVETDTIAVAASTRASLKTLVPVGEWWVEVANGAGKEGEYYLAVTPAATGSS